MPHASRSARMNSAFGSGFGAARLTGAGEVVAVDQPAHGADEIALVDPRHELPAVAGASAEPAAHEPEQHVEHAAAVRAHDHRRAQQHLPRARRRRLVAAPAPTPVATSMLKRQVSGASGSAPPMTPVASSFAAS